MSRWGGAAAAVAVPVGIKGTAVLCGSISHFRSNQQKLHPTIDMKVLMVMCVAVVAVALAAPEAPRYRAPAPAPVRSYNAPTNEYGAPDDQYNAPLRQYNAPINEYGAPEQASAPYPPSGWKPAGRQFVLPQRQTNLYEPPPPVEYGPPATEAPATTEAATEELPTTTEQADQAEEGSDEAGEGSAGARAVANAAAAGEGDRDGAPAGVYYVLLPDGRLQRVAYSTDPRVPPPAAAPLRNAGFAQLQYMDVEPVRAPIYSYGSPFLRVF